jgi:hypothetical protein
MGRHLSPLISAACRLERSAKSWMEGPWPCLWWQQPLAGLALWRLLLWGMLGGGRRRPGALGGVGHVPPPPPPRDLRGAHNGLAVMPCAAAQGRLLAACTCRWYGVPTGLQEPCCIAVAVVPQPSHTPPACRGRGVCSCLADSFSSIAWVQPPWTDDPVAKGWPCMVQGMAFGSVWLAGHHPPVGGCHVCTSSSSWVGAALQLLARPKASTGTTS